jgi:NDP-sugar pyrophosphorylase family protein
MRAMILAAGVGSRLRPLTYAVPKALVEIGGTPMLEIVLRRLIQAGCRDVVINVHHFADRIEGFLKEKNNFGIHIEISREEELLETGGGLKKVAGFFDDSQPFMVHNVDVLSNLGLREMAHFHAATSALATLAVQARRSSRYFLFDEVGRLCGWESVAENRRVWTSGPVQNPEQLAFNGIHVISPKIFGRMSENGAFSIIQTYLRLAGEGCRVQAFRADACYWREIGRLDTLEAVRREIDQNGLPV